MINAEDRQNLARMIGELTPELIKEADLRTQLHQRAGFTGPLGVTECVNMIRFVGLGRPDEIKNEPLQSYDFRNIPINSELWVKQEETGLYRKAIYAGDHPGGKIAVRYHGHHDTRGVKPVNCLLHEPETTRQDPVIVDSPVEQVVQQVEVQTHTKKGKKPEAAVA